MSGAEVRVRIGLTSSSGQGVTMAIETIGRGYLDGVVAVGGLPVVLPSLDPGLAVDAVASIDGVILTGGGDLDPNTYGAPVEPESGPPDHARDAWELALVAAARGAGVPVLGICRGAQVLNVAYGGTLVQDLPTRAADGHDDLDRAADEVHVVSVEPGSLLDAVVGSEVLSANTLHHQSIDRPGDGLRISGRAEDGVVEAIESADLTGPAEASGPVLGVQWHPELLLDRPRHLALFAWLVDASARR